MYVCLYVCMHVKLTETSHSHDPPCFDACDVILLGIIYLLLIRRLTSWYDCYSLPTYIHIYLLVWAWLLGLPFFSSITVASVVYLLAGRAMRRSGCGMACLLLPPFVTTAMMVFVVFAIWTLINISAIEYSFTCLPI